MRTRDLPDVWHVDLAVVPTRAGFWVPWFTETRRLTPGNPKRTSTPKTSRNATRKSLDGDTYPSIHKYED